MKDVMKIVLLLVGAYLVWLYLSRRASTQPQPAAQPQAAGTAPPVPSATPALVAAAAAQAGYAAGSVLTADQWNYFHTQVRGTPAPDPLEVWPDRDRSYKMTVTEWWTGMSTKGLGGLSWPPAIRRMAIC